ncbi:sterile alpha motif domain-containing protein 13 [Pristis pectinata]|uniref:sterile alpha motif domain-containing protein 13 n=1 Tax=Pristis pectinata TaxID=685728 RepID=UPI00223DC486|nr:sterile alpha motif domain-containing protein 13 [Pristis pectinata]XP_051866634.1 sterile alpha motif domain-containing protein 13 [Pristis pectinata]XP_051866635.1 sterile alpha motif domain-containing protein 13 [Pristis pectinata]
MEMKYKEWILETIDSLRSRKARPDVERICRMIERRHGLSPAETEQQLDKLVRAELVVKVAYKGSNSYRNAAKWYKSKARKGPEGGGAGLPHQPPDTGRRPLASRKVGNGRLQVALKRELSRGRVLHAGSPQPQVKADSEKVSGGSPRALLTHKGYARIRKERAFEADARLVNPATTDDALDGCMEPELTEIEERASLDLEQDASEMESVGHSSMDNFPKVPDSTHSSESSELLNCDAYKKSRGLNGHAQDVPGDSAVLEVRGASCLPTPSASPVEMKTFETSSLGTESPTENTRLDPVEWTILDVFNYFKKAGFEDQAAAFQEQEIDGKSLLLMKRSDVLTGLSIKLGPALKIYEFHVKALQMSHLKGSSSEC